MRWSGRWGVCGSNGVGERARREKGGCVYPAWRCAKREWSPSEEVKDEEEAFARALQVLSKL